jgi:hypothetical protein
MHPLVKGMVQVAGKTYRIVRHKPYQYEAIRILDDVSVGTFRSMPPFCTEGIDLQLLREIARVAIQAGKTSWVGRLTTH